MYSPSSVNEQINAFGALIKSRVHLHKCLNLLSCLPNQEITQLLIDHDNDNDVKAKLVDTNEKLLQILAHFIAIHNSKGEKYRLREPKIANDIFLANYDRWPTIKRRFFQKCDEWNEKTEMKVNLEFKCLDQSPSIQVAYAMQNLDKSLKRCHPLQLPDKYIGKDVFDKLGVSDRLLSEIYTDQDYYIHLLKQLVNIKGGLCNEKQLKDGQKELYGRKREKNTARKSKERQIRYVLHEKLEHFMEPMPPKYKMDSKVINLLITSLFK